MIYFVFENPEEENKFYYLYEKYHKLLYKTAYDILRNQHDAEDALQIALEKIYHYFYKISDEIEKKCLGYMIVIIRNVSIDIFNQRKKVIVLEEREFEFNRFSGRTDEIVSSEKFGLENAIKKLDGKYRDVLLLKYVYGYSLKEIADMLNITETNVSTRLNRGKAYIKEYLRREEGLYEER